MKNVICIPFFFLLACFQLLRAEESPLKLWYDKPANDWMTEALPIGNGRLGGMIFGGTLTERIQFNEISLWSGDEKDTGAYQAFGDLFIDFLQLSDIQNYKRELDIQKAVHIVSYISNGIHFKREYFSSAKDQVIVMRISADRKGSCNGVIRLTDMHNGKIELSDQKITGVGKLENGLMYESGVIALNDGGEVKVSENALKFERANSITIILAAGTNYLPDYSRGWRGENPHRLVEQQLKAASLLTFNKLRERHIADYQSLFTRVDLNIGESELAVTTLPTDQRLVAFKKGGNDPDLEELFFQYGRYLLISSSRPGSLPANLQGIWNNSNKPPWRSDYHSNINVQMNYWPAEVTNLSECHIPFGIY